MPPLLRISHGLVFLGTAVGLVGGALGGQWMRFGVVIMGAGFLPFAVLMLTNFRGEYSAFVTRLDERAGPAADSGLSPDRVRYGFGSLVLLLGVLFLVTGLMGGPGVTKPGGLF
jgi:hypothetical protein